MRLYTVLMDDRLVKKADIEPCLLTTPIMTPRYRKNLKKTVIVSEVADFYGVSDLRDR